MRASVMAATLADMAVARDWGASSEMRGRPDTIVNSNADKQKRQPAQRPRQPCARCRQQPIAERQQHQADQHRAAFAQAIGQKVEPNSPPSLRYQ